MSFQKMYGFGGVGLSEVQISISELSVVGGGGGRDKRTSWSDLVGVRQIPVQEKYKRAQRGNLLITPYLLVER